MEQILTVQDEFEQLIRWTEEMFNVRIKVDEWTGVINPFCLGLNFEFARFQKENSSLIDCYNSLTLCLRSYNGKLDFGESNNVHLDFNHKVNKYGDIRDLLSIEIKDNTTGYYDHFYPQKAKGMLEVGWNLDADERKDFFNSILEGAGRRIRAQFIYTLTDGIKEFDDTVSGEVIEAVSVDKQHPNITLVNFLKLLEIVRLYEIICQKNSQQKPLIDAYLELLPTDESEKITQLVDEAYDYFKGIFTSFKSISSTNEEKIQKLIRQISTSVNIEDINVLNQVIYDRYSIPCIREFCDYCMKNQIKNNAYDWISRSKGWDYNILDIHFDIEKNRPSGCLFFFKKNTSPEFGPETKRFISDFKKHFNTK